METNGFHEPSEAESGGFWEDDGLEGSYSDHDAVVPQDSDDDHIPDVAPEEATPNVRAEDIEGFRRTAEYLKGLSSEAHRARIRTALEEPLSPEPTFTAADEAETGESLAAFDAPETERGRIRFDQGLNTMPYQKALEATGVELSEDPFSSSLKITDGRRFVAALAAMPTGDEVLRYGVETTISRSIHEAGSAYIPSMTDESYGMVHAQPALLPEIRDDPAKARVHADLVAEVALNVPAMIPKLTRLGVDPGQLATLRGMHLAVADGMLPYWAVANEWQAYDSSDQNPIELLWSRWGPDEGCRKLHEYLDAAAEAAPADSRFMSDLASSMLENIDRFRRGDPPPPQPLPLESDDFVELDETTDPDADARYEAQLDAAEQKLRRFILD